LVVAAPTNAPLERVEQPACNAVWSCFGLDAIVFKDGGGRLRMPHAVTQVRPVALITKIQQVGTSLSLNAVRIEK